MSVGKGIAVCGMWFAVPLTVMAAGSGAVAVIGFVCALIGTVIMTIMD